MNAMGPVKVVAVLGDDETEIGTFNQGVFIQQDDLHDVASGERVLTYWEGCWVPLGTKEWENDKHYERIFIQAVPAAVLPPISVDAAWR